jgi:hypothetical protein
LNASHAKFFQPNNLDSIEQKIKEMENDYRHFDSKELRRFALHFNERKFKADLAREARKLVPNLKEEL